MDIQNRPPCMDTHDSFMDIQNFMLGKIIDIQNWIMDVNL